MNGNSEARVANDDPPAKLNTDEHGRVRFHVGTPQVYPKASPSSIGVLSCRSSDLTQKYVSLVEYDQPDNLFYFSKSYFAQDLSENVRKELLSVSQLVVIVFTQYQVIGAESELHTFAGSGMLINHQDILFVVTARHNVFTTRKSSKSLTSDDLQLHSIKIKYPFGKREFPAARYMRPETPTASRAVHLISDDNVWTHNEDFALLKLEVEPSIIKLRSVSASDLIRNASMVPLGVKTKLFIFGIPGSFSMTEQEFALNHSKISFADYVKLYSETFVAGHLHVSEGEVTEEKASIVQNEANTAGGMSGGPVFSLVDDVLTPVGIHVGGTISIRCNYFIPYMMPEFAALIDKILLTDK